MLAGIGSRACLAGRGYFQGMPVLVGTSGWQYKDWRGGLYPAGVAQRRWLEHYATQYRTVENNGSFYRLPLRETFEGWRERTPDDFVMAVKASRYLTHVRKLRDPAEPVARLLGAAAGLGPKIGADSGAVAAYLSGGAGVAGRVPGRIPGCLASGPG